MLSKLVTSDVLHRAARELDGEAADVMNYMEVITRWAIRWHGSTAATEGERETRQQVVSSRFYLGGTWPA